MAAAFLLCSAIVVALALPAEAYGQTSTQADPELPRRFDLEDALAQGAVPLTADRAVELALGTAPALARARSSVSEAEAEADVGRTGFSPHVELGGRYARVGGFEDGSFQVPGGGPPVTFEIPRNQMGVWAEVALPITDWIARTLPNVRAAGARVQAEELLVRAARADVALAARTAFYDYVRARGALAVARAAERQAEAHRKRVAALGRAGLATEADRLEARAHVASASAAVIAAEGEADAARTSLEALLHFEAPGGFALPAVINRDVPEPVPGRAEMIQRAYDQRAELRATEQLIESQSHRVRAAGGEQLPRLAATARYDYAQPNQYVIPPQERFDPSWRVGLSLTWSPDRATAAHFEADRVAAARARLEAEREELRDRIRVQVAEAYVRYRAARSSLAAARAVAKAAEDSYRARVAELAAGRAVASEVVDADTEVVRARRASIDTAVQLAVARARLEHAIGTDPAPQIR